MMKTRTYLFLMLFSFASSCSAQTASETPTGLIQEEVLVNSHPWFSEGYTTYTPDAYYINELKKELPEYTFLVFAGVWCEDTQVLLPQFYKTIDLAGLSRDNVELYLLDRKKKSRDRLERRYKVAAVPVFIIMKDGKEAGRIVESVEESIEKALFKLIH